MAWRLLDYTKLEERYRPQVDKARYKKVKSFIDFLKQHPNPKDIDIKELFTHNPDNKEIDYDYNDLWGEWYCSLSEEDKKIYEPKPAPNSQLEQFNIRNYFKSSPPQFWWQETNKQQLIRSAGYCGLAGTPESK